MRYSHFSCFLHSLHSGFGSPEEVLRRDCQPTKLLSCLCDCEHNVGYCPVYGSLQDGLY